MQSLGADVKLADEVHNVVKMLAPKGHVNDRLPLLPL
jgi:hypothetical protein